MAPTTAFASVRFYYPPGDRRLSHWRVIRFDVASGKILERCTDPLVDATFTLGPDVARAKVSSKSWTSPVGGHAFLRADPGL